MQNLPSLMLAAGLGLVAAPAVVFGQDSTVGLPAAVLVSGPMEGDRAPDFSLPWASADTIVNDSWFGLSLQRGKVVVLAFYPKDFTSGCTAEMKTFTEQFGDLFGSDVVVVGISSDSLTTHRRFAKSLMLPFRLLSDPDQKVSGKYGSAGRDGYNRRTVFVIDRKGKVAYTDLKFGALDPKAYASLKSAVQGARRAR
jgi:peroxiredoxin Q/BCP